MPKKLTNEEFLERIRTKKPTLIPMEEYVDASTPIKFKCNVCGHTFHNSPSRILGTRNQGCAKCYHNTMMTSSSDFMERAKSNTNVEVIGEYAGSNKKILVRCIHCGYEFSMRADSILEGRGHQSCMQKKIERIPLKTQEQFINELKKVNDKVEPLGIYNKSNERMLFKCTVCGNEWETLVKHVLYGDSGCPRCKISKGESRILKYLQKHNVDYIHQHTFAGCKDQKLLPFDFYIPNQNTCIEYDGEQHFREVDYFKYPLEYIKNHDMIKTLYCKNNDINLIRIPYTDFDNIEEILDEFIA